ncbi:MAG: metallophosphoesterase [Candidatus Omnitrophica bacterium]|nr:metallophosphoesterase [Candidatus Omnitrophota bacterium]
MKGVVKVESTVNVIGKVRSFTVLGDPGCDGLGVEIMTTFSKAMNCAEADFKIILGDLVPFGLEEFYKHISGIINDISGNPVYSLCGNHDTEYYGQYFGLKNYLLVNEDMLIVVLDNSKRKFDEATLDFCAASLRDHRRKNILVLFHIPPPTQFSSNSMKREEWDRIRTVMAPYREDIRYILAGHVHSYFEDDVDGFKVVVSGGGGARLDFFGGLPDKKNSFHHVLQFSFDEQGILKYRFVSLADIPYDRESKNEKVRQLLEAAFQYEAASYTRFQFFAQDAYEKGFSGIEKLFRAFSKSAYYHAKNYFSVLNKMGSIENNLKDSVRFEKMDLDTLKAAYLPQTLEVHSSLAYYGFYEAYEAKKKNFDLLPEAIKSYESGEDIKPQDLYVCTSCGNMRSADAAPDHCHICGAPPDKIIKI